MGISSKDSRFTIREYRTRVKARSTALERVVLKDEGGRTIRGAEFVHCAATLTVMKYHAWKAFGSGIFNRPAKEVKLLLEVENVMNVYEKFRADVSDASAGSNFPRIGP